ncbi:hypothetical protein ELI_0768 [Eubacterium callanderi]|uniref:Uncharacterized protein n=1 Tax=Eubacterium callanderi TaxID=53442 RepID=E3GJE7_9FIRM|nr:hypothetical protein ELI_0768 [Eubacterium callanderi]
MYKMTGLRKRDRFFIACNPITENM